MYLYRAIDSVGDTIEFFFSENRDLPAAKRFLRKALARHGRPERIVIDGKSDQSRSDRLLRCRKSAAGSLSAWRQLDPHSPKPISEQPHRAGSPSRQAPCSVHARLQVAVECRRHSFRHRDGQHDAQTTGEVCLIRRPRSLSSSKFSPPDHLFGCVVLRPKVRFATHPTKQPN